MGNDAGYRDTLPTRSKRGYLKRLEESREQKPRCEDHDPQLAEMQDVDLSQPESDRWLEL